MNKSKRVYDAYRPSNFIYNKKNLNNQNFTKSWLGFWGFGVTRESTVVVAASSYQKTSPNRHFRDKSTHLSGQWNTGLKDDLDGGLQSEE